MKLWSLVCVALLSTAAYADNTAKGDKATTLARALKFAGVKAKTTKTTRTYAVAKAHCWSSRAGNDEMLGDYKCSLDKLELKDGAAYLVQTALEAAGVDSDDHMEQHTNDVTAVTCTLDSSKAMDDRAVCTWAAKK